MVNHYKNYSLVLQQDQSDCGVACLLSVIKYYGGNSTVENIRKLSGTNITGTTLLGLYQAAASLGFKAEGCEADIAALYKHPSPVILHVLIEEKLEHYVVCYGTKLNEKKELLFIIGDPAKGIVYLNEVELSSIWKSKICLTLEPNERFVLTSDIKSKKKDWIIQLIKEDYPFLGIALLLGIAIATLGIIMSLFSQRLIDDILPKKNFIKLNLGIALVFMLLIIKEGLSVLRQYFLFSQSKNFNNRIIGNFYSKLLNLPKPFFDTRKIGELTARLTDTSRIQRVISQLAGNVVIDSLVAIVVFVVLFNYSWKIALASLFILPVYFILIYRFNKKIIDSQKTIMSSYAMSESNYISTLQGIEPIKNYNKQELFSTNNNLIYSKYQAAVFSFGKIQIKLGFIANSFGVIFLLGVLLYNSHQVLANQLKIGELMAILGLCSTLLPSIANLALISIPINEAKIAFDRMFEFTGLTPELDKDTINLYKFESLRLDNVLFRFAGRSPLLNDISFEVKKGEVIALMGENGCGKSTLTQIISKNYEVESGKMVINEDNQLHNISYESWRRIIGIVPQQPHIFNGTVIENICFEDAAKNPEKVNQFLKEYGFFDFINSLPQSYMTIVGEEGINLSGGQKQMIALARALYHKPQLLILDEATASMDRKSEQFVLNLLCKIKNEMGIIFITHRLHVLKSFCDRIYIIENGTNLKNGTHETLLQSENIYSNYWNDLQIQ
ncbi:MAG: peptidase domain-containing ABC transporter [Sediminibacterium sp.]